ncbi:MAG: glutamate-5-semialdehyde dehydrogenase [Oscillospiraceae bacterium]|nr:glutamate-5-semialdehyde dehydrogenase [Oscillospiraceae bacterium]
MDNSTLELCKAAKRASAEIAALTTDQKNDALAMMAQALLDNTDPILEANAEDVAAARGTISDVMIDRLSLSEDRIAGMADGIRQLIDLPDPVGQVDKTIIRPNGIKIEKTRTPLGVVAIIYESRPNVTSDAASLAFKSGNAVVLRGGKESYRTSKAIVDAMKAALKKCGITEDAVSLVSDLTHASADVIMNAVGYVDLLIPRGGARLINHVTSNAKVPYIQTGSGICHVYVDASADLLKAVNIVNNAKTQRPSVCNAEEVLLVHKDVADEFLPMLKQILVDKRKADGLTPVELRLDPRAAAIIDGTPAGPDDFDTEYNDYILSVKVVDSVEEAVKHIQKHSTHHSEAIVTESEASANYFTSRVDSAAVYVNVSTRFTDGGEFGLGCEMGISTQKLHARGPMGLVELTTYKYIIHGDGQIRS